MNEKLIALHFALRLIKATTLTRLGIKNKSQFKMKNKLSQNLLQYQWQICKFACGLKFS